MKLDKKIMRKKRSIGWVVASLSLGMVMGVGGGQVAHAANWEANSVSEIQERLKVDLEDDGVYTIEWGDTLSAISLASGVTVSDLADANHIQDIDLIYAGDTLIIDRDAVSDLVTSDSYVDYKENKVAVGGEVGLAEVKKYNNDDEKPSTSNKKVIEELEHEVEQTAEKTGKEAPKPIEKTPAPEVKDEPSTSDDKEKTPTPEDKDKPSISDDKKETSTPEVKDEPSTSDDKEETPTPEDKDKPSISDDKEETPTPEDKDEPSTPDDKEETPTPEDKDEPSTPDDNEETPTPEDKDEPSTPDDKEETPAPEDKDEPSTPDDKEETPAPEDKDKPSTPDDKEETPAPEDKDEPSTPDDKEETPTPEDKDEPSTPDDKEETPAPEDKDEPSTPDDQVVDNDDEVITEIIDEEIIDESKPNEETVIPVDVDRTETISDGETEKSTEIIPGETIPGDMSVEKKPVLDEEGNPVLDEDGNPVVEEVEVENPDQKLPDQTVDTVVDTKIKTITPGIKYVENPDLEEGQELIVQEGVEGKVEIKTTTKYIDGEVVDVSESSTTLIEVVDQIVHVGSKPKDTIVKKLVTRRTTIPFKTIYRENPALMKGEEQTVRQGINGVKEEKFEQTIVNGEIVSDVFLEVVSETEPVHEIIEIGTKVVTEDIPYETEERENSKLPEGQRKVIQEGKSGKKNTHTGEVIKQPVKEIVEVGTKVITEDIPYETEERENPELPEGERKVVQKGKPGKKNVHTGKVIEKPVNEIIEIGTKSDTPDVDPENEDSILNREWASFLPTKGETIVRPGRIAIDTENMTVKEEGKMTFYIKDVTVAEGLQGKTLADIKNDPDKDKKAVDNSDLYKDAITSDVVTEDEGDMGRWRDSVKPLSPEMVKAFNDNELLDVRLMNEIFVGLVNKERQRLGKDPIRYEDNSEFNRLAEARTRYQAEVNGLHRGFDLEKGTYSGPHTLPNGKEWIEAYNDADLTAMGSLQVLGENTASSLWKGNPYQLVSESYFAHTFYNVWKNSPNHYRMMMSDNYDSLVFTVKSGERDAVNGGMISSFVGITTFGMDWN